MIAGFKQRFIEVDGLRLSVHVGGNGPPLLMLHGFPQNHMTWASVAGAFAETHTCIIPDLRGYGDSDAPEDDAEHTVYSKRRMALDACAILDALGHETADVLGHDRGARVAYRMALDHPERVNRLGIIEIVPTGDFWASWGADLALKGYHWTFLAQPFPLPEQMIGADPTAYVDWTLQSWTLQKSLEAFSEAALASYRAQAQDTAHLHGMCADYRAGATFDRQLDDADRAAGRKISCPVRFLYAEGGFPAGTGDPEGIWKAWADDVTTQSCIAGHFAMEENPEAVLRCFLPFFE